MRSLLPAVSVWAFLYRRHVLRRHPHGRAAQRHGGGAGAVRPARWLLVPAFGNHGLWLAFLTFLGARAVILALIYRRAGAPRASSRPDRRPAAASHQGRSTCEKIYARPLLRPKGHSQIGSHAGGGRDPEDTAATLHRPVRRTGARHSCSHGGLVMRSLDLTPLFRSTVGFDHLDKLFETAFREAGRDVSYPPYNIAKIGQDKYRISMAVAGFGEGDLDITAHGWRADRQGPAHARPRRASSTCIAGSRSAPSSTASSSPTTSRSWAPGCATACSTSSWCARCPRR